MTSLDKYILTIDDVLPIATIGKLVKVLSLSDFDQATVGEEQVNFEIRRTWNLNLYRQHTSLTNVHWYNLLHKIFYNAHLEYMKFFNTNESFIYSIKDIQALKYKKGGFYKFHSDHYYKHPRTLSFILLLNNDYKGGKLCFKDPLTEEQKEIDVKSSRLIVWPSNFLYPHTVTPVEEGTRYSIVAWGL